MGKRGPKPDPEKQNQIQTKIYLKPENWAYVNDHHREDKTRYFNKLVERDRLENMRQSTEETMSYPVKEERLIKG